MNNIWDTVNLFLFVLIIPIIANKLELTIKGIRIAYMIVNDSFVVFPVLVLCNDIHPLVKTE